jgi:hypothetical protein
MRYLVKLISNILLIGLSIADAILIWIMLSTGIGVVREIQDPPVGTLDGSPTPILDAIGQGYRIFFLILIVVMFLIVMVQAILNIFFVGRAVKEDKYGYYLAFSLNGIAEVIINTIIILVTVCIGAVTDWRETFDIYDALVLGNVIMGVFLIINLILANKFAKEENP